ncbi:hypothetical protein CONCODRAFT_86040 [Conidiobolus coronatus NRRL 28638]|uniref:SDE2-like domain-containing protein n=1 Tax=Conidiobolus coronatus (strain ATCC 28846 / CBS 209.66 / NRRL 28638) TaxID=796925 RepID=A0A137P2J0_CONC2|nr:hypothetical protein CONCODRAFT_86040 [Conidiobolus coronatus NRRL 28638]|eukprot:KXN69178.1 hypothetical protein CONCODRAFT_86040 [Conidiobolus coronatus NRRL 28638]
MSNYQILVQIPDLEKNSSFFIPLTSSNNTISVNSIEEIISEKLSCSTELFYLSSSNIIEDEIYFENDLQTIQVNFRGKGGKGGFGSMLRSQGGKMNSQQTTNFDSCRDLSGRRLKTIKDAKKLVEYQEQQAELEKEKKEKIKEKIEKIRFDDDKYIEQTKQAVSGVKSAVALVLKNKPSTSQPVKTPSKRILSHWDDESEEESSSENESDHESSSESEAPGK